MKMKLAIATAMILTSGATAFAADSGCGLGSMIISRNTKLLQLFAMTTNGTTQPFGITTGTSGCTASGFVMNDKAIDYFTETNQADLAREMAQGAGEKLDTLASLHGCDAAGAKEEFASVAQKALPKILPTPETSARDMVRGLQSELRSNPAVVRDCAGFSSQFASL